MLKNFQAYNKLWVMILTLIISFCVSQGWIAPDAIDEKKVSQIVEIIGLVVMFFVPNKRKLSTGEKVNVDEITGVVDQKVAQAAELAKK